MPRLPVPSSLAEALSAYRAALSCAVADLHLFDEVPSTNSLASELAESGAPEGTVVIAHAQTRGRGRLGRAWHSPPGTGLYVSMVLRPAAFVRPGAPDVALLTLGAGVGVAEGIASATGFVPALKWPNDLVTERLGPDGRRGFRKLGGILAEASVSGSELAYVVVGLGINLVTPAAPDLRNQATSIEEELGRPIDGEALLGAVLLTLADAMLDLRRGRTVSVLERWRALSPSASGRGVEWQGPDGLVRGTTAGIDASGALLIEQAGRRRAVGAGEVRWT
jgi:BirA family transcriptional regulator, biotin operon repressor / biotin---[acetyl-CoA-carboxylase] ligase